MGDTEGISGPWRATKLWNDIIRNFRSGMPLKKHKKNLRTFESCFSSAEAIDWLHKNLQKNPNFGSEVTKEQTIQLLKKLHRAGIIENVKEDSSEEEFKLSGELYRFSNKSPVRNLRTPGKENRKPLADTGNTPRLESKRGEAPPKPERDKSVGRKAKEEMKKQLNFSYFQALPSNSLIILDNDDIWRKVYMTQLSRLMTSNHTERLDYAGQLDMENVTHNMTKVSSKGIVQVDDKSEDLPHWVLSAMKCLANWPKQLRTVNGEESCLPSYAGFESDVFNVVKDYFLGLQYPLTTCTLYEFLLESYQKAEGKIPPPTAPKPVQRPVLGCNWKPPQNIQPGMDALYGYSQNNITNLNQVNNNKPMYEEETGCFYKMTDSVEDFAQLSNQERVAKIKQTFQILPPLATSSLQNSNNTSSSLSGHTTFDAISYSSLSPGQPGTSTSVSPGIGNNLPPRTCYETAFVDTSPITRIVPQKDHEVLHIKRSFSGRSLIHIPSSSNLEWASKSTSTQTDVLKEESSASSLKRVPRWKRTSRFRKSIAIMENQKNRRVVDVENIESNGGVTNHGFVDTPIVGQISMHPTGTRGRANTRSESVGSTSKYSSNTNMRGFSSVDNLLDKEKEFEEEFMLKYRQVSGDLRGSCDLVQASKTSEDSRYLIQSKTVRKEKKKRRYRGSSEEKYGGYATDSEIVYDTRPRNDLSEVNERYWQENRPRRHCSSSNILEKDFLHAPLAMDETVDLSPVPFDRNNKYNTSYRMATNQPATPLGRSALPRTSTKIKLPTQPHNQGQAMPHRRLHGEGPGKVQEEIYSHGSKLSVFNPPTDADDVFAGRGAATLEKQGYAGSMRGSTLRRNTESRMSRCSQATGDSGRYSDISRASTHRSYLPTRQHTTVPDNSDRYGTASASRTLHSSRPSAMGESGYASERNQTYHQPSAAAIGRTYQSLRGPPTNLRVLPTSAVQQSAIRTIPPRVLSEKLSQLPQNPGKVEDYAISVFKLLTLLIPPCNRRKLQLLLKFIRKVSLNHDLTLSNQLTNREYSINTFTTVILRPSDPFSTNPALDRKIVNLFIDKYEEIWSPPESLRSEVEDKVYRSLVNRRLEAGEDPYPITYCMQVTKQEYEEEKLTGAQAGLLDLLEAMLVDIKMNEKEKMKKLKKFKSAYPEIWRRKFASEESEPPGLATTNSAIKINKFSSLSRIKNRIGM